MNDQTNNYIQKQWQEILGNKKVLGVHVRGTDFGQGFRAHPKMISAEEFKQSVIKMMQTGEYDKIFLATDDSTALAVFKEELYTK